MLCRTHYSSKNRHLSSTLLLSVFHTTTLTSDQMRGKARSTVKVIPKCTETLTWDIDYPDRGSLPSSCVWNKLTSLIASWAGASVKTELETFYLFCLQETISKGSNSYRDMITSVSPRPISVVQVIGCGSSDKVAQLCLLD